MSLKGIIVVDHGFDQTLYDIGNSFANDGVYLAYLNNLASYNLQIGLHNFGVLQDGALNWLGIHDPAALTPLAVEVNALKSITEATDDADLGSFFYDDRSFRTISREYWDANGPADGSSLHHWLFPQSADWVPQGIRNAGFNLMELPPIIDTPFGGLNQWMGMSRSPLAPVVDWGIRIGVPASIGGAAYGGAQVGNIIIGNSDSGH
jgi:hypothetical protein